MIEQLHIVLTFFKISVAAYQFTPQNVQSLPSFSDNETQPMQKARHLLLNVQCTLLPRPTCLNASRLHLKKRAGVRQDRLNVLVKIQFGDEGY